MGSNYSRAPAREASLAHSLVYAQALRADQEGRVAQARLLSLDATAGWTARARGYDPEGPCDPEFTCPEVPCVFAALAACLQPSLSADREGWVAQARKPSLDAALRLVGTVPDADSRAAALGHRPFTALNVVGVSLDAVERVILGDRLRLPLSDVRLQHVAPADETDEDVE